MLLTVFVYAALLQQPGPAPARAAAPSPTTTLASQLPGSQPATAYDSTTAHIGLVGVRVAEVRSGLDVYRRAAFNDADGSVMQRSDLLRRRCQALTVAAQDAARSLCRTCTAPALRNAIERYRAELPRVVSLSRQCATTIESLSRGPQATAAAALRREVRNVGGRITQGLQPYESRIDAVRQALGAGPAPAQIAAPQAAPRPSPRRNAPARPRP